MKNMKKYFAAAMSAAMVAGLAVVPTQAEEAKGSVYYLNFKPEQATQWEDLAKIYTEQTGVEVNVLTAASGTYESTLKSEMAKDEVPTLFQVNGPVGLATWKDYCLDLKDSDVYSHLKSDDFALKDGDSVYGLAYVIETYGLIYNKDCFEKAGIDKLPTNMDELEEACKKLKDAGITPFALAAKETWVLGQVATHFMISYSSSVSLPSLFRMCSGIPIFPTS